tara:strand:- start:2552 stop:2926 length:375 start_codon:yes stop_codon:yes gene_type:complete
MKIAFVIIFIHWVADFVLQTDKMAKGKSKNWYDLLSHTLTYSTVWCFAVLFLWNQTHDLRWILVNTFSFATITFVAHTITDYFTSRLNSKLWAKGDVHNFFVSVGFDQVLHYGQLFLTFYLLNK